MLRQDSMSVQPGFVARVLIVLALTALFVGTAALLWAAARVFVLLFAGVLLAVLLRALADCVHHSTGLPEKGSLALTGLMLLACLGLAGWFLTAQFIQEWVEFNRTLAASWQKLDDRLREYEWGRQALHSFSFQSLQDSSGSLLGSITGAFNTVFGAIVDLVVILFVGIYLAADPNLYRRGVLHLLPLRTRGRAYETLAAMAYTLRWWLLGRLLNMTIVGLLTALGLWLLGIPLVLPLSLIAFVLDFVPYFGPILAAIPAILVGVTADGGLMTGVYVGLLYLGIQSIESYVTQPLIQSHAVQMPPALLVLAQVLMGILLGPLGLLIASPLTAAVLVAVKMLYVEDALGDRAIDVKAEQAVTA